jgi:iron complex outermembrane receptor protein
VETSLPNLTFSRGPNSTIIAVRGVGALDSNIATENRVAIHTDGVYYSRTAEALNQFFDLERIEYLRGPQGTLYGRNATAGAINIITRDPVAELGGYLTVGAGTYAAFNTEGALNLPINDLWSSRLSFTYNRHGGYDREIISGKKIEDLDTGAVRGKLKYENGGLRVVFSADYGRQDDRSGAMRYIGPGAPGPTPAGAPQTGVLLGGVVSDRYNAANDFLRENDREYYGASANANWTLGEGNDLTAIVGYRMSRATFGVDIDLTSVLLAPITVHEFARQTSAELRFHRATENYDLLVGAYYFQEKYDGGVNVPLSLALFGGPQVVMQGVFSGGYRKSDAYAAFAQLRWNFTPEFYVEAGARYSYERGVIDEVSMFDLSRVFNINNPVIGTAGHQSESWDSLDPKVTFGYKPSDNVLAYATVGRGFKSGGFNLGGLQAPFEPEKITDFEAGLKLTSSDRRLTLNTAAFYYRYSNMQVFAIRDILIVLENAAKAEIKGVEAELRWLPTDNLNIGVNAEYLDATYKTYTSDEPARLYLGAQDLSGNKLPQAPPYRLRLDATYTWFLPGGDLSIRGDATWTGRVYFTQFQRRDTAAAPAAEFNAFVTYDADNDWTFQAFARNLTNRRKVMFANVTSSLFGFGVEGSIAPPRTFGVSATKRW